MKKTVSILLIIFAISLLLLCSCNKDVITGDMIEYEENFDPNLPLLDSLTIDGGYSLDFSPKKRNYKINLPLGNPYVPNISATAPDGVEVKVYQAFIPLSSERGEAKIILSKDGYTNVYTLSFMKNENSGFVLSYDDRYLFTPQNNSGELLEFTFESSDNSIIDIEKSTGLMTVKKTSDIPVTLTAFSGNVEYETLTVTKTIPAKLDIFIIAGQSNAEGIGGNADESLKPVEGVVYSAETGSASMTSLSGGRAGFTPALGKKWNELTNRKVLMLQCAQTSTSINDWVPGGVLYSSMQTSLDSFIEKYKDENEYIISSLTLFWLQGEWDMAHNMDAETYEGNFLILHENLKNSYGMKYSCIIPTRSSRTGSSEESISLGLLTDLLPVRAAQYTLHRESGDIYFVSRLTESMSLSKGTMNDDNLNMSQTGYNMLGEDAANNYYRISSYSEDKKVTGIEVIAENGRSILEYGDIIRIPAGSKVRIAYLCIPFDVKGKIEVSFASDVCSIDKYGMIQADINAPSQSVEMYITCGEFTHINLIQIESASNKEVKYTKVEYEWSFNGNTNEKNEKNNLSRSILSPQEGGYEFKDDFLIKNDNTVDFTLDAPVRISSDFDWSIEWRGCLYSNSILLGQGYDTSEYIYLAPWSEALGRSVRFVAAGGVSFALSYGEYADKNNSINTWKIVYKSDTHALSLYMDNTLVSEITIQTFDITFTNMFGRYGSISVNQNFQGEVNWLKVTTYAESS